MDESELLKYIKGTIDDASVKTIEEWILRDETDMLQFVHVKDEYILSTLPNTEASEDQMLIAAQIVRAAH